MATLSQSDVLTLEFSGVSQAQFHFTSLVPNPDYSYAAGGSVQWSTAPVCAWCGTGAGEWGLYWNKTEQTLTVDFGKVVEKAYVTLYSTFGTSNVTLVQDSATDLPETTPVPLPAGGALLGSALLMAAAMKRLRRRS